MALPCGLDDQLNIKSSYSIFFPLTFVNFLSFLGFRLPTLMRFDGADPGDHLVHEGDAAVGHHSCTQAQCSTN